MANTYANECRKAALDGILGLLTGGDICFTSAADAELATLPVTWGAATLANPSTAAGACTADTSVTAGTITKYLLRNSAQLTRINGAVGVGSGDLQVTNNVVPVGATEVSCSGGLTFSLQLAG